MFILRAIVLSSPASPWVISM